jgi:tetratricopeptide (TPR) repeat protein
MNRLVAVLFVGACASCSTTDTSLDAALPPGAEAFSLFGEPLYPPEVAAERRATLEADLERAHAYYVADPMNADAILWYGRRLAYLGRHRAAISFFTEGIGKHPYDPRFYRHRGHRFITLRRFDDAVKDLEHADRLAAALPDAVEPDGQPNAKNVPIGTMKSNILYHLGLAHYLRGDFAAAEEAYARDLALADNPDRVCSASYWLYLIRMRRGNEASARQVLEPITPDMDVIENFDYHRLLLTFKGTLDEAALQPAPRDDSVGSSTIAYGLALHDWFRDDRDGAMTRLRSTLAHPQWGAFGRIAAEADLADPSRLER